ncbi:MAG: dihydrofolate reductase family protein, partial [Acidimicrobiia bacterium]|nr:dihydrofolate reductase family protein [Acidimicrobiia bacterium]
LGAVLDHLGAAGIVDLMVEGGPTLSAALLRGGLIDRLVLYLGARVAGGVGRPAFDGGFATLADATPFAIGDVTMMGPDVRIVCERTAP